MIITRPDHLHWRFKGAARAGRTARVEGERPAIAASALKIAVNCRRPVLIKTALKAIHPD